MADITISSEAADRILRLRDPRAALYYLHLLSGGGATPESAAANLGWSEAETLAAQAALTAAGILVGNVGDAASEASKPAYSTHDLTNKLEGDPAFSALFEFTQARMNRLLSSADTASLLEIYDHLGMPAGEIMLLVSHCVRTEKRKKGDAARVTMWTIEREARRWLRDGIDTEQKAEQYVRSLESREQTLERLKAILQIRGRELTASERKYLEKWAQSGLEDDAIYMAYDRTVIATGALKWPYMDRIIEDWKQNGVPDPNTERKPSRPQQRSAARRKSAVDDDGESAADLLDRMTKKGSDER